MKPQIIRIFSIFAAGVICCTAAHADLPLAPRIKLRHDLSGRDAEFLRRTIRQLERLRRLSKYKLPGRETLTIIPDRKKFFFDRDTLELPGDALRWESDPELRRLIYAALAAHRFDLEFPPRTAGVAPWIGAGLDNGIMAAETAGQYVAGNSSYALVSSLSANGEDLPDFGALCRLDHPGMAVADDFAAEQSRLLLEIFARNGRIRELFAGTIAGKAGDFWLSWYTSAAEARQALQQDAAKLLFDRYNPMPPPPALEKIADLELFLIPELGADGKNTGRIIDGDIGFFCNQLAIERPDAQTLRRTAAAGWRQFGRTLTINEREICHHIAGILLEAGANGDTPRQFKSAVTDLKNALLKRQKSAAFMTGILDKTTPPMLRLLPVLRAADDDETSLSDRQREFFNRTMDNYLK